MISLVVFGTLSFFFFLMLQQYLYRLLQTPNSASVSGENGKSLALFIVNFWVIIFLSHG